jgi:ABC-type sulfate transport system permease component
MGFLIDGGSICLSRSPSMFGSRDLFSGVTSQRKQTTVTVIVARRLRVC